MVPHRSVARKRRESTRRRVCTVGNHHRHRRTDARPTTREGYARARARAIRVADETRERERWRRTRRRGWNPSLVCDGDAKTKARKGGSRVGGRIFLGVGLGGGGGDATIICGESQRESRISPGSREVTWPRDRARRPRREIFRLAEEDVRSCLRTDVDTADDGRRGGGCLA